MFFHACYNHSMYKVLTAVLIVLVVLVGWWAWDQLHGALSVSTTTGNFKFISKGQDVSVPCTRGNSITSENVTLYTSNPDTLMKYLALQQVKTCSAPITCMAKGFDGDKLYLDPNCYFDLGTGGAYADVFEALDTYLGVGKVVIGSRQLESDPVSKLITLSPYYFITGEQGVELVRIKDASLDKFWQTLGVTPQVSVDGNTANVSLNLPSYDDHLLYAISLNIEHFMKVSNVVININGLEAFRHSVPYGLKLAQGADGYLVTGELQDSSELRSFLIDASITDSGNTLSVKLDEGISSENYSLVLAVLDTVRGRTVKITAGPYTDLGSFPSQF